MSASTVRAHENGQNGVGILDLERYARRYGVSVDWLVTGRGEMDVGPSPASQAFEDIFPIMGVLMDGRWIKNDDTTMEWAGWDWVRSPGGNPEEVEYGDPRYPRELLSAFKVRIVDPLPSEGPYLDGSVVIAIDQGIIGARPGDHVVVIREKEPVGGYADINWTLKKIRRDAQKTWLDPLISTEEPIEWQGDYVATGEKTWILGVVVGSVTRRPVPALTLESRIMHEEALKAERQAQRRTLTGRMSRKRSA